MCLSVSSVWAQNATTSLGTVASDVTAIQNLESGYYVIQATAENHVGYIYYNGNAAPANAGAGVIRMYYGTMEKDTIGTNGSLAYVWHVTHLADKKQLVIQCAGNGGFWPNSSVNEDKFSKAKTIANAAVYTYPSEITPNVGVRLYQVDAKLNGQDIYVHKSNLNVANEFQLSYWNGPGKADGSGSACCFKFYKFTPAAGITTQATPVVLSSATIKYIQQIEGTETNVEKVVAYDNKFFATPTSPWEYSDGILTPKFTPETLDATTESVVVNFVKKTSSTIGLDTYHRLNIGRSTQLAVTKNGNISTKYCTKNFLANYLSSYWKFVQDGLQVKMVNCDGKYLKLASVPTKNDGKGAVQYVDNASDATNLYLCEKPSNSGYQGNGGFILKVGDPSNNVAIGDHDEKKLSAWKNSGAFADEGSCFVVADNVDLHGATSILLPRLLNDKMTQAEISDNILRVADNASIELANTALSKVHENITPGELIDAYNLAYKAKIDENAYYRVKNQGTSSNEATAKRYPSSEAIVTNTKGVLQASATRTITRKTASDNMVAQLWQFKDAGDGNYFIQNANTGCRWAATEGTIDMPTMDYSAEAGHYSIDAIPVGDQTFSEDPINSVNDGKSKFFITLHLKGQHVINAYGGLDNENLKEDNSNNTPCNDAGNYWQIEKVTSIPVTITEAKYATVGYPFNVKVTNPDVKVYYAKSAANGVMKLTEATDKIIPANEGAILYYEGEGPTTANLDIVSEAVAGFVDNILTASTAKRTGFETKTTYGLSNKEGKVSFRLNTDNYVPANKSYLLASKYSNTTAGGNAQQLLFSFDNVVEGIDNAVVDGQNANKVYYDLQGRRVMYPAHGIFVTENGEKVFIK